mmetsp:Transcript_29841/g.89302  ORF Transcript_29841/g.89302 Transcript_29841/m.89302 type:complete len:667 (-) Transcript_29841:123-2123(-)
MMRSLVFLALAHVASATDGKNPRGASAQSPETSSVSKKLKAAFQKIADDNVEGGKALQIAFADKDYDVAATAGTVSKKGRKATNDDKFPSGSIVKPLTAASIMRLAEDGKLKISDPMYKYVDEYFASQSKKSSWKFKWSSLKELYGEENWDTVSKITVKDLLDMTAPIPNFNWPTKSLTTKLWDEDGTEKYGYMSPEACIELHAEEFPFGGPNSPGGAKGKTCNTLKGFQDGWQCYSSSTYVMLGFILANAQGKSAADMDQAKYLPSYVASDLSFSVGEPVSKYSDVHPVQSGKDWYDMAGPMVGWTASNALGSASTYADMSYEIYSSEATVTKSGHKMGTPQGQKYSFSGSKYGLGTEIYTSKSKYTGLSGEWGEVYGHSGDTYGSNGDVYYSPKLDGVISVVSNYGETTNAICLAYNTAINILHDLKRTIQDSKGNCKPDPVPPDVGPTPRPGHKTPNPTPSPGPGPSPSPGGGGCPNGEDYGDDGGCGCIDDSAWEKGNSGGDCGWAGKDTAGRCGKKSDDGDTAYVACGATCTAKDSTSWMKGSDSSSNCNWVAGDPQDRCGKKMDGSGEHAYEACPHACGCPDSKKYVKKHKLKKSALAELAAKIAEAEDSVAVRVPTLVAVCVLAGVALGGVAALLAPKAKEPTEQEPLLAVSKTESFGL